MSNVEHPGTRIFLLRFQYELYGQNCENGFWFRSSDATCGNTYTTVLEELQALISQFNNTVVFFLKDCITQDVHFLRLAGSTKEPLNGPVDALIYESQTGVQAPPALPGHDAIVLSLYLGLGGRMNRGRSYYSGIGEADVNAGNISPELKLKFDLVANELLTRFGEINNTRCWTYCLFHRHQHDAGASYLTSVDAIKIIRTRREIRTERHRMLDHGT